MALLYRAIWESERHNLIPSARGTFQRWIDRKQLDLVLPEGGVAERSGSEVAVAEVADGDVRALRIRLIEERDVSGGEERWTTTAHWMTDGSHTWVWVDLEWVSDDAFARQPDVVAPRLVGMLLEDRPAQAAASNRIGPSPCRVAEAEVGDLVDRIYDRSRTVPVVVFAPDARISPPDYSNRVREVARRLAGCADVRMLTTESGRAFDQSQRDVSMSVFDGAARVYLPGVDGANPLPWRHRYVRAHLLTDRPRTAAGQIAQLVLPRMVAQRPPTLYRTHVKQLLDQSLGEQTDWEAMAIELDESLTRVQREIENLREAKDLANMEALDATREAADSLQRLEALRSQFRVRGEVPELIEQEAGTPRDVESCADAVSLAASLKHIVIHPEAPREISRMDESSDSELWGQRIWAHLQCLNAYAEAQGPGLKIWCESSGHPRAIARKFIAMTESETVCNNRRLRRCRHLPVDSRVDPSGKVEMFAHIKSIEGGGMQIPRIYFHDDTKGKTAKVHVGFIGPHDLMRNTLSN